MMKLYGISDVSISLHETDETADLSLLIILEKQMLAHLQGQASYHSPWNYFFTDNEKSLGEEGYLVSADEKLMFILMILNEDNNELYKDIPRLSFVPGSGGGRWAVGEVTSLGIKGKVEEIELTSEGEEYTSAPEIKISNP